MNSGAANLLAHTVTVIVVVGAALTLALGGEISGGEALVAILAAGGVGVAGALGVTVGSRNPLPPGG